MSEPRHATVMAVVELLGVPSQTGPFGVTACRGTRVSEYEPAVTSIDVVRIKSGTHSPDRRITCDRCAIIVDAALEGVKPFPFSLPGVPDEVLR